MGTTPHRRRLWWLAVVALSASSCMLGPIPGPSPLRYRDEVFGAVTKTSDLVYGHAVDQAGNDVTLQLDLYQPTGDATVNRPLIIWIHGGYFSSGDKTAPEIVDEATTFAKKGYVTASINYRTSANGCRPPLGPDCVQAIYDANADAQTAVRYLRSAAGYFGIDPTRIAIGGSSAGAITALNVGYRLPSPGAPTPSPQSEVSAAISLSGAEIFLSTEDAGDAPALLFHGTSDTVVPYSWATATVDAAQDAGLEADLIAWADEGHMPYSQHRDQIIEMTTNFVYRAFDLPLS